jgi:hypothetical protein
MKIIFVLLIFTSISEGARHIVNLPTVSIDKQTLGGDILLINMKDYLVIQGSQSKVLENELGSELKKNMTRDMVMTKPVKLLLASYGRENCPVTNEVINRYGEILELDKKRKKLE